MASNSHEFILVAIDYFTKWVEATLYKVLNSKKVAQFIQTNSFVDMGYHISREKQRSYFESSIFSTMNPHPTVLKSLEQLRLQTRT